MAQPAIPYLDYQTQFIDVTLTAGQTLSVPTTATMNAGYKRVPGVAINVRSATGGVAVSLFAESVQKTVVQPLSNTALAVPGKSHPFDNAIDLRSQKVLAQNTLVRTTLQNLTAASNTVSIEVIYLLGNDEN